MRKIELFTTSDPADKDCIFLFLQTQREKIYTNKDDQFVPEYMYPIGYQELHKETTRKRHPWTGLLVDPRITKSQIPYVWFGFGGGGGLVGWSTFQLLTLIPYLLKSQIPCLCQVGVVGQLSNFCCWVQIC